MTEETIQLQSVGRVPAKLAVNVKVGDTLMWNFGVTSEVVAVRNVSACFVEVTEKWKREGYGGPSETKRKLKKTRLVGYVPKK